MDTVRAFDEEHALDQLEDNADAAEALPAIGTDERRLHVRAYNHWASLLNGRPWPSIADLEPAALTDFGPHSVLLDFTLGPESPRIAWLGRTLRAECGLDATAALTDIPRRSLLSRLTDHYLQIIANRTPIGFEAEFVNARGASMLYRGILMPYSSNETEIDFVYGVINGKEIAEPALAQRLEREVDHALATTAPPADPPVDPWPNGDREAEPVDDDDAFAVAPDAGLADLLGAARASADAVKAADGRSRAALYRALGLAYDFALVSEARADDYAELLADAGLKRQARAPMTPIVKLVFGTDYDKTRLTEFAAALAYGRRSGVAAGGFRAVLEDTRGGLKALVASERRARTPQPKQADERGEAERARLRAAPPAAIVRIPPGEEEFVVLLARRVSPDAAGVIGTVADHRLVDRAVLVAAPFPLEVAPGRA